MVQQVRQIRPPEGWQRLRHVAVPAAAGWGHAEEAGAAQCGPPPHHGPASRVRHAARRVSGQASDHHASSSSSASCCVHSSSSSSFSASPSCMSRLSIVYVSCPFKHRGPSHFVVSVVGGRGGGTRERGTGITQGALSTLAFIAGLRRLSVRAEGVWRPSGSCRRYRSPFKLAFVVRLVLLSRPPPVLMTSFVAFVSCR
jgi:hypothetical protein